LGRRNLTPMARTELALALEDNIKMRAKENQRQSEGRGNKKGLLTLANLIEPANTRAEVAKVAGVSGETLRKAKAIIAEAAPEVKDALRKGTTTINREYRTIQQAKQEQEEQAAEDAEEDAVSLLDATPPEDRAVVHVCSIGDAHTLVEAGSVDAVITRPMPGKGFRDRVDSLAQFAAHALKEGGSLLCVVPQVNLSEALDEFGACLTYHWTIAMLSEAPETIRVWGRKITSDWTPVLWFTRGEMRYGKLPSDVIRGGVESLVTQYTVRGNVVCDPLCPNADVGVAAVTHRRRFIGCNDMDGSVVHVRERIMDLTGAAK